MNIFKATAKINSIFLAVILIAGTFAVISPSFIVGVQAQSETYYGMDKDRKDISVSSLKCNNINVNVNGLELDVLPSFLSGELVDEAQESTIDASSFVGNGPNGWSEINDFRFVCINNNNNTVIEEETPIPPVDECAEDIEACFEEFLGVGFGFDQFLRGLERGVDVEINGVEVTFNSFEGMCSALEDVPSGQLEDVLEEIITDATGGFPPLTIEFLTCVAVAVGLPLPH